MNGVMSGSAPSRPAQGPVQDLTPDDAPCGAELTMTWIAAATLYFLLAVSTIRLTSDGNTIATVWPANAVLVALLLVHARPRWLTVLSAGLVGNIAANWLTRGTVPGPLLYGMANGLEVVAAVVLIRGRRSSVDLLQSTRTLFRFILAAGIAAPTISALAGTIAAMLIYQQGFGTAFRTWFVSDSLGLLVFTPVFMVVFNGRVADCFLSKTWAQRAEAIGYLVLVAVVTHVVFFVAKLPALFLLYAPVMLATFRIGPIGTKMAVMTVAVIGTFATASGHGPVAMVTSDLLSQSQLFQTFLAVMLLTCLPVAAGISERNRLARELEERAAKADAEAVTDMLTGLLNRRGFDRSVQPILARGEGRFCCVAIDVDHFKGINDRWGHPFGDRVLQHLAAMMRTHTRTDDILARLGGDEFLMILHAEDKQAGEEVCKRIQTGLRRQPIDTDEGTSVMVGISCGVAPFAATESPEDYVARADLALYDVKRAGRDGIGSTTRR